MFKKLIKIYKKPIKIEDFMKNNNIISENYENKSNVNYDNKTKEKSSAQKVLPVLIIVIIGLLVVLTCVLIAYYQVYKTNKQNANILEGVYASSYYSMVDNVNNLSVDVSKYSTLTTRQSKINTMQDMVADCNYILAGLGTLPINQENVVSATKFFNQISGVCEAYTKVLNNNKNLTIEQELLFEKIGIVLNEIKDKFNNQNYGMYDTGFNFVDAGIFDNDGMNELSSSMGDVTSEAVEYPVMIFDGPFSASLETKIIKGLPVQEISVEDAKNYLKQDVYKDYDAQIEYDKTTDGDIDTYDFKIIFNNEKQYAQVSKRGGLLITLSGEGSETYKTYDEYDAVAKAEDFANSIGFKNMKCVWKDAVKNIEYINLAPVVNGVIYYPDLVKVKIDLGNNMIVGLEALNYALNHTERELNFVNSESEAESILGFDYDVLDKSKAVIKLDGGREIAVYEFHVDRINGEFYYYVDALTNQIAKVLKVVETENSFKLI